MTTFSRSVPRIERATSAPRLSAIVKAVRFVGLADPEPRLLVRLGPRRLVDVRRRGRDDRGGYFGDDWLEEAAAWRSSLGIIPSEMSRPKRSEASCWIGRLARR